MDFAQPSRTVVPGRKKTNSVGAPASTSAFCPHARQSSREVCREPVRLETQKGAGGRLRYLNLVEQGTRGERNMQKRWMGSLRGDLPSLMLESRSTESAGSVG